MDLNEMGCRTVSRIRLARDRFRWQALVNMVMNPIRDFLGCDTM
jgi:hypothetical protein